MTIEELHNASRPATYEGKRVVGTIKNVFEANYLVFLEGEDTPLRLAPLTPVEVEDDDLA